MEWIDELENKLWKTKGSRFNANKRIATENLYSRYSMGFFSICVIAINLYSILLRNFTTNDISNVIPYFSIILGILILFISIMERAKGLNLKAEKMLSCAKEISGLYDKLRLQSSLNKKSLASEVAEITKEYNSIISKYDNHEPIDYEYFKTNHPNDFKLSAYEKILIRFKYFVRPRLVHSTLILIIFVALTGFILATFPEI